jgi:hypothetical protein
MGAAIALVAVQLIQWPPKAHADIQEGPKPEAFLSGGARSEIVLKEMAETLRRIDTRLERFERALREVERDEANQRRQPEAESP